MTGGTFRTALGAVTVLLAATLAVPATGAPTWLPSQTLSDAVVDAAFPQLAVNARGDAALTFSLGARQSKGDGCTDRGESRSCLGSHGSLLPGFELME